MLIKPRKVKNLVKKAFFRKLSQMTCFDPNSEKNDKMMGYPIFNNSIFNSNCQPNQKVLELKNSICDSQSKEKSIFNSYFLTGISMKKVK